ncbi:MAG TPA: chemotaxis protein CheD [Longimicrobium sp.]|nr:chemotaxis protein CheD [Longimicrobium sp.]
MSPHVHGAAERSAAPGHATARLYPGDLVVSAGPVTVTATLGSCVSVCLFDAAAGVGGMNHFLLPDAYGARPSARFARPAMERLLAEVLGAGARHERLRARVYGGACVLDAFSPSGSHLGERNVRAALAFLEREGIPVVARDTGGRRERRVTFRTGDGAAEVRFRARVADGLPDRLEDDGHHFAGRADLTNAATRARSVIPTVHTRVGPPSAGIRR